jgi:hypothetical protein
VDVAVAARRRERQAWQVVLASFATFCLLLVGTPVGIGFYRDSALSARSARLDIIRGTVLYLANGSRQEINATDQLELREGDQIRLMNDSLALVFLHDGSNVQLFPESTLLIEQSKSSAFNSNRSETVLVQRGGRSRIEVAPTSTESRRFEVHGPGATAQLREGSYAIQVTGANGDATLDLSVRRGSASVTAEERTIEVLPGERTAARVGEPPGAPQPALRDFVANGSFAGALDSWQTGNRAVEDGNPGDVSLVTQDGRNIVRFQRRDSSNHAETYIHQTLDRDVTDLQRLAFGLQLKIVQQSLSGGGWIGSEYPVTVRLRYRDVGGSETTWVQGFFVQNAEGRPTTNGQLVPKDIWVSFSADLFDPNRVYPRPAQLLWIEIEASGWQYESMVTGVQLLGE